RGERAGPRRGTDHHRGATGGRPRGGEDRRRPARARRPSLRSRRARRRPPDGDPQRDLVPPSPLRPRPPLPPPRPLRDVGPDAFARRASAGRHGTPRGAALRGRTRLGRLGGRPGVDDDSRARARRRVVPRRDGGGRPRGRPPPCRPARLGSLQRHPRLSDPIGPLGRGGGVGVGVEPPASTRPPAWVGDWGEGGSGALPGPSTPTGGWQGSTLNPTTSEWIRFGE